MMDASRTTIHVDRPRTASRLNHGVVAVMAQAPAGEDHILTADLDLEATRRSHAHRLFLRDRRPELYPGWL